LSTASSISNALTTAPSGSISIFSRPFDILSQRSPNFFIRSK